MRKIIITLMFIAAVFGLSLSVYAEDIPVYAESGFSGNEYEFFAPSDKDVKILSFSASGASCSDDAEKLSRRISNRIMYLTAYLEKEPSSGSASVSIDYTHYAHSLDDSAVLRFGIQLKHSGEPAAEKYNVTAIITTDSGDSYSCDFTVPSESASLAAIDLRSVEGVLTELSVTVSYNNDAAPSQIILSAPYADYSEDPVFITYDKYSAGRLSASVGMIASSVGVVRPADGGQAEISGKLLSPEYHAKGTTSYLAVTVSGIKSGGLSAGITFVGTTAEQRYYTKKISLPDSSETAKTVLFPIEILDGIEAYALYFTDVVSSSIFRIESVQLLEGLSVPFDGNYEIGNVSSLTRDSDHVYFEGTMERNAVRLFRGQKISFYAIPASSADDLTTAYILGSASVSTEFSFSADLSEMAGIADTFMFFAALSGTDENGMNTLMPLSKPRYPDPLPMEESKVSIVGLTDAAAVGVFEANVSNVTITVDLYELITDSAGGIQLSYIDYDSRAGSAKRISLNRELLSSLDSDIQFYISSGTKVYLQLISSQPIDGLTYSGESQYYMPDLSIPGARYLWAAIIHSLSERFGGISGYVIGKDVNTAVNVSPEAFMTDGRCDYAKVISYTLSLAELARITYTAASVYISDMPVALPVSASLTDSNGIPAVHIALLLSQRFSQTGSFPCAVRWTLPSFGIDDNTAFDELTFMRRHLEELEIQRPTAYTFSLEADSDTLMQEYEEYTAAQDASGEQISEYSDYMAELCTVFYEKCKAYHARAAFVSLEGLSLKYDPNFYSAIKNTGTSDRYVYEARAVYGKSESTYNYTLFDFSDKHYPLGWIAGGGVRSCITDTSRLFTDSSDNADGQTVRVLRTEFSDSDEITDTWDLNSAAAGIALRNLSRIYNFNEIDTIEFTFALDPVSSDSSVGEATVVMVIGNDDCRAEYPAPQVTAGEIITVTCDLTGYVNRNAVDYIGIMVYSDNPIYLELSKVRVGSETLTEEELAMTFTHSDSADSLPDLAKAGFAVAFAVILAVVTTVILTNYDREEDEKREAANLEAQKYRRNRR